MRELTRKRVKVIAYYPDSPFALGQVLYESDNGAWYYEAPHQQGKLIAACTVQKATAIFSQIKWYEGLDRKDFPTKVKWHCNNKSGTATVTTWLFEGLSLNETYFKLKKPIRISPDCILGYIHIGICEPL